jgi:hypothetical protein
MKIRAKMTIETGYGFHGVPVNVIHADIGGKTKTFTSEAKAIDWLRAEAVKMQIADADAAMKAGCALRRGRGHV